MHKSELAPTHSCSDLAEIQMSNELIVTKTYERLLKGYDSAVLKAADDVLQAIVKNPLRPLPRIFTNNGPVRALAPNGYRAWVGIPVRSGERGPGVLRGVRYSWRLIYLRLIHPERPEFFLIIPLQLVVKGQHTYEPGVIGPLRRIESQCMGLITSGNLDGLRGEDRENFDPSAQQESMFDLPTTPPPNPSGDP